jgi:nucleotide-binding universal stress UspA family protein
MTEIWALAALWLRRALAATRHVEVKCEVAVGHAAEQILYHADSHGVDLIVLGHRGKSVFRRLLVGSVSKQVMQHASQPVLVVR